ncbi:MAG: aminotransferase class I/II-fold pyridoxal phosphate-dependent enzyme [Hyphomicrobiaceae bacterium]
MSRVGLREWLAVAPVFATGRTSRYGAQPGRYSDRCEARLRELTGAKYAIAMNSGTNALASGLAATGIGPGDEVLVPAYTWLSTAAAVLAVGAVPILVDIDETITIDPADIERRISKRTRAIIPVHMGNIVCAMAEILEIARRHNLIVIEDACQAAGVRYRGKCVGTIGDAGAFSFNSHKNINVGEGGALLTNDEITFQRSLMYHDVGAQIRHHDNIVQPYFTGFNFKVTELSSAVLNVQLSKLPAMMSRLRKRHDAMKAIMEKSAAFRICPHNDPDEACGMHVIFETPEEAKLFAQSQRGTYRLLDSGRHVYTNWDAIMQRNAFHPLMNVWERADRDVQYSRETCARTLDILGRTCHISLGQGYPTAVLRYLAKGHANWRNGASDALYN